MNLNNKNRLKKDIVVYENFIDSETAAKLIKVLDKHAELGTISWMPISFYESYSSVLVLAFLYLLLQQHQILLELVHLSLDT